MSSCCWFAVRPLRIGGPEVRSLCRLECQSLPRGAAGGGLCKLVDDDGAGAGAGGEEEEEEVTGWMTEETLACG